jgi:hypothetical protein
VTNNLRQDCSDVRCDIGALSPCRPAPPLSLHLTETEGCYDGTYLWRCRCGASAGGFTDRAFVRQSGDEHLAAAHAPTRAPSGSGPGGLPHA